MIVDDEADVLVFLSYNFKNAGYMTFTAEDGVEGLKKIREVKPDLVISDIRMPHMDGIELCKKMKSESETSDIPIVFLTADDDEYLALSAVMAGAEHYMTKPASVPALIKMANGLIASQNK